MNVAIAFFDLDRTLIAGNSAVLWLRSEVKLGRISRFKGALAHLWVARYHLGFAGKGDGLRHAISMLTGSEERDLRERTVQFYEEHVRELYRPGAREVVEWHRARGDRLVLLTSSTSYIAELVCRDLGFDAWLCNRFEVDANGLYTGKPLGDLCYGDGKRLHAERHAAENGVSLGDCAFYTDSYADIPVMRRVGRPVAVNPDRRLRREAQARGWEVVDWGMPELVPAAFDGSLG